MKDDYLDNILADKLRDAIHHEIVRSKKVRSILNEITKKGLEPKVWVLMGVAFNQSPTIRSESLESFKMSQEDLQWLKSLKISIS